MFALRPHVLQNVIHGQFGIAKTEAAEKELSDGWVYAPGATMNMLHQRSFSISVAYGVRLRLNDALP
jgi:hypothetical protein